MQIPPVTLSILKGENSEIALFHSHLSTLRSLLKFTEMLHTEDARPIEIYLLKRRFIVSVVIQIFECVDR